MQCRARQAQQTALNLSMMPTVADTRVVCSSKTFHSPITVTWTVNTVRA